MEVVLNGNTVKVDDLRVKLSGGVPIGDDATFPQMRSKVIIEAKGEVSGYDLRPIKGGGQALVVKVNVDQGMIELVPPDPNLFDAATPADFGAGPIPDRFGFNADMSGGDQAHGGRSHDPSPVACANSIIGELERLTGAQDPADGSPQDRIENAVTHMALAFGRALYGEDW